MPPISSPTAYHAQPFDVQMYSVGLQITNLEESAVTGVCRMDVTWTSDVAAPLFPFHLRGLVVDSIVGDSNRALTWLTYGAPESDTFHYRIKLDRPVLTGSSSELTVYYHGAMTNEGGSLPWGGVHYEDSVLYALGVGFNNLEVSATAYWMPCYDHPSDKARLHISITLPKNGDDLPWAGQRVAASTGTFESFAEVGDGIRYTWDELHPTATYLYTFAIGAFVRLQFPDVETTPIIVYSLARDTSASNISYKSVPRMLSLFNRLYTPFPFDKVGYVNTTRGAMEHQTLISFPLSVVNKRDSINTTAAHELAHQWFGDYVTPLDFSHAWLTESFATYSESAWIEEILGWNTYLANLTNGARTYIDRIAPKEGVFALHDFPRMPPSSNYPETIYRKGANVVAMARTLCGTDDFYASLRRYLQNHAYGDAVTSDMKEAFRPALGSKTDAFFSEWVDGLGWPQLRISFSRGLTDWQATITQVQQDLHPDWPIFTTLPINVTFRHPNDGHLVDTIIIMEGAEVSLGIQTPTGFGVNSGTKCRSLLQVVTTTSVASEASVRTTLTVRPMPASSHVTIEWEVPVKATLSIDGINGQRVFEKNIGLGADSMSIDVSKWSSGLYHIQIDYGNGRQQVVPLLIAQ